MVVFAIHQHESAMGIYMCPTLLNPPPTSLLTLSLPEHHRLNFFSVVLIDK